MTGSKRTLGQGCGWGLAVQGARPWHASRRPHGCHLCCLCASTFTSHHSMVFPQGRNTAVQFLCSVSSSVASRAFSSSHVPEPSKRLWTVSSRPGAVSVPGERLRRRGPLRQVISSAPNQLCLCVCVCVVTLWQHSGWEGTR